MKILELFSGTECISNAFRRGGHECFTIDWNEKFPSSMHCDIETLQIEDLPEEFRHPDVVWIGTDCTSYSLAAISHHRRYNPETGNLDPVSEYAKKCDRMNKHVLNLLNQLQPKVWWIENPRACLQKMDFMKPLDKYKHVITYCKYETDKPVNQRRMKPTNLWTNIPNPALLPPCHNGADDHAKAPRGSRTGTQGLKNAEERSMYPHLLCEAIVEISSDYIKEKYND